MLNEKIMNEFHKAWRFLREHINFKDEDECSRFEYNCLDIQVTKVNPLTETIEDDVTKNTAVRVWLECGEWIEKDKQGCHDTDLDCGARTFEKAIIELAILVKKKYGDVDCINCFDKDLKGEECLKTNCNRRHFNVEF